MKERLVIDEDFIIDYMQREVFFRGKVIPTKRKEYEIIKLLSEHPRQVMSRVQIYEQICPWNSEVDPVVVTTHISYIRAKLTKAGCKPYIQTVWGFGYKWEN